MSTFTRRIVPTAVAGLMALTMSGCVQGESGNDASAAADSEWSTSTLAIEWATYNPLSLGGKDQGLIEGALGDDVDVTWLQSAGSNKANEVLRSSRKLHSDLVGGTLKSNQMAARGVQRAIRDNLPGHRSAA